MITLEQIRNILNHDFQPPFVADGLVEATYAMRGKTRVLSIRIASRDVSIDENGNVTDAGTFCGGSDEVKP